MSERLTDSELRTLEQSSGDDCDMALVEEAVKEIRALRAAAITAEEREALITLRSCIVEREGEYILDLRGAELSLAAAALARLTHSQEPRLAGEEET